MTSQSPIRPTPHRPQNRRRVAAALIGASATLLLIVGLIGTIWPVYSQAALPEPTAVAPDAAVAQQPVDGPDVLERQNARLHELTARLTEHVTQLQAKVASLTERNARLVDDNDRLAEQVRQAQALSESPEATSRPDDETLSARLTAAEQQIAELTGQRDGLESELRLWSDAFARLRADFVSTDAENQRLAEQYQAASADATALRQQLYDAETALAAARSDVDQLLAILNVQVPAERAELWRTGYETGYREGYAWARSELRVVAVPPPVVIVAPPSPPRRYDTDWRPRDDRRRPEPFKPRSDGPPHRSDRPDDRPGPDRRPTAPAPHRSDRPDDRPGPDRSPTAPAPHRSDRPDDRPGPDRSPTAPAPRTAEPPIYRPATPTSPPSSIERPSREPLPWSRENPDRDARPSVQQPRPDDRDRPVTRSTRTEPEPAPIRLPAPTAPQPSAVQPRPQPLPSVPRPTPSPAPAPRTTEPPTYQPATPQRLPEPIERPSRPTLPWSRENPEREARPSVQPLRTEERAPAPIPLTRSVPEVAPTRPTAPVAPERPTVTLPTPTPPRPAAPTLDAEELRRQIREKIDAQLSRKLPDREGRREKPDDSD